MSAAADILCFGEVLLRLAAPKGEILLQSPTLRPGVGGAEANVAVSLARLGRAAAVATILPDSALGRGVRDELRRHGVDTSRVRFAEGRLGLYFLTPGAVSRPPEVIYDRAHTTFVEGAEGIDWDATLSGASWLHLSGSSLASGPGPAAACLAGARAARAKGLTVSFDGNFRGRLWAGWGGDPTPYVRGMLELADVALVNHRDVELALGAPVEGEGPAERFARAADRAFATWPHLQWMAGAIRTLHSVDRQEIAGCLAGRSVQPIFTPPAALEGVVDRIGGGDAYAAGIIYGLAEGWPAEKTLRFALANTCLKHSIAGDANLAELSQVTALAEGGGLDVTR